MKSNRLEAFSDGVLAIIITIMVLEMKAPENATLESLVGVIPVFLSYVVSFIYIGTYWNNHHHLLQVTERVNGKVLWANLHLLFWLSLIPFATSWVGENHVEAIPVALYGFVLLMSAIAYTLFQNRLIQSHSKDFALRKIASRSKKGLASLLLYILGIVLSLIMPWLGIFCYVLVLAIWFIPERRIESALVNRTA